MCLDVVVAAAVAVVAVVAPARAMDDAGGQYLTQNWISQRLVLARWAKDQGSLKVKFVPCTSICVTNVSKKTSLLKLNQPVYQSVH